jgi:hypothetical protein
MEVYSLVGMWLLVVYALGLLMGFSGVVAGLGMLWIVDDDGTSCGAGIKICPAYHLVDYLCF